jgi:hypothetical protein
VAVVAIGALAFGRLSGDDDTEQTASGGAEATAADLFAPAGTDLGAVEDEAELRTRLAEEVGLGDAGGELGTAESEAVPGDVDTGAAPRTGEDATAEDAAPLPEAADEPGTASGSEGDGSEPDGPGDCELSVVSANPDLAGRLLRADVLFAGVEAEVLAFGDGTGDVQVFVVARADCGQLTRFSVDGPG